MITETLETTAPSSPSHSDALTRAKQVAFLLAIGQEGQITAAAKVAEIHRDTHYGWMEREPAYAAAFAVAVIEFGDRIRSEITERALKGWLEPVVFQGQVSRDEAGAIVAVRKKSERLLELLAKAMCPEFKDRVEVAGKLTLEQLLGGI